jgi:hypothetical protein
MEPQKDGMSLISLATQLGRHELINEYSKLADNLI